MTDQEKMKHVMTRVRDMLADNVAELEAEGGDVRYFAAAFLTAGMQLHVEVEGTDGIERAIAKIGARELVRAGAAGRG